jgi:8-oxo-dGTP diphosphatase
MSEDIQKTVGALLIDEVGRVLLGLRARTKKVWPDHWDTVGGRVEPGESLEAALIREVQEEIGVTPTAFELIATVREREPERYGDMLHHIYTVTRWTGGAPTNICDEHSELKWFDVAEISGLTNIVDCDYPRIAQLAIERRSPQPLSS